MITTYLMIAGYIVAAVVATIAIFNNDKLVIFEDRVFAEFKNRRKIRKEEKKIRIVENYLDENGLTVIPKRGVK